MVDYLSKKQNRNPWLESELSEKFVVRATDSSIQHLTVRSNLNEKNLRNRSENVQKLSRRLKTNACQNTTSLGCFSNQIVQNGFNSTGKKSDCQNVIMLFSFKISIDEAVHKKFRKKRGNERNLRRNLNH